MSPVLQKTKNKNKTYREMDFKQLSSNRETVGKGLTISTAHI
jgi:hypothetical protein